jgi:hypothetical protein
MYMSGARSAPILFVLLSACSSIGDPSAPVPQASATTSPGATPTIEATGSGTIDLSAAGATDAVFELVANVAVNGTASGHFRQRRTRGAFVIDFAGRVTCLTVDLSFPGRARVGGVITKNSSTDPAFLTDNHDVGDDVWFRVQDGGSGPGDVDASTTYGFKPTLVNTSLEYCALPFDGLPWWNPASIFPLKRGSIRVIPS